MSFVHKIVAHFFRLHEQGLNSVSWYLLRLWLGRLPFVDFTERRAHQCRLLGFGQSVRKAECIVRDERPTCFDAPARRLHKSVQFYQPRESSDKPRLNAFCRVAPSVSLRVRAILAAGFFDARATSGHECMLASKSVS
jgi:hypothetical protein